MQLQTKTDESAIENASFPNLPAINLKTKQGRFSLIWPVTGSLVGVAVSMALTYGSGGIIGGILGGAIGYGTAWLFDRSGYLKRNWESPIRGAMAATCAIGVILSGQPDSSISAWNKAREERSAIASQEKAAQDARIEQEKRAALAAVTAQRTALSSGIVEGVPTLLPNGRIKVGVLDVFLTSVVLPPLAASSPGGITGQTLHAKISEILANAQRTDCQITDQRLPMARCRVGTEPLAATLVKQGVAVCARREQGGPTRTGVDGACVGLEAQALQNRAGIWANIPADAPAGEIERWASRALSLWRAQGAQ